MARRTNFHVDIFNGRTGFNHVAANAGDFRKFVFRMNSLFHNFSFLPDAEERKTGQINATRLCDSLILLKSLLIVNRNGILSARRKFFRHFHEIFYRQIFRPFVFWNSAFRQKNFRIRRGRKKRFYVVENGFPSG